MIYTDNWNVFRHCVHHFQYYIEMIDKHAPIGMDEGMQKSQTDLRTKQIAHTISVWNWVEAETHQMNFKKCDKTGKMRRGW